MGGGIVDPGFGESQDGRCHPIVMPLFSARRNGRRFVNPVPTKVGGLSIMFKVGPQFFLRAGARSPRQPLGPFHTDARVYATSPRSGLRVTWFGHASSLVEIDGVRVLIDPVWDERAAPTRWVGPKRFFAPPLALEDLPAIDAVIISHDHYDHLGAGTVQRLARLDSLRHAPGSRPWGSELSWRVWAWPGAAAQS
jgi:hypothetical protein